MNFFYNSFAIHNLGEVTASTKRDYEDGQRCKVTLTLGVTAFQRSYADNYSLFQQLHAATRTREAVLQWTNTDITEDYINQTATLVSDDLPEEWGEYTQHCNLVFVYYEQNLITNNLPLTYAPGVTAGTVPAPASPPATSPLVTLGNVSKFKESWKAERFSPFHSPRSLVRGEAAVAGLLLVDTTEDLDDRRAALITAKAQLDAAMNSPEGTLQLGDGSMAGGLYAFNRVVRIESYESDIDQLHNAIAWSFTANYTIFPEESDFATMEYTAEQRDENTGEQFVTFNGKITATDETTARAKLAAIQPVALTQYGFATQSQQLRNDSAARSINADDGALFVELSFNQEYRRWRTDNQVATFTRTGGTKPVPFGNVKDWDLDYSARRFSELRSQRSRAGGQVTAKGTWLGDPTLTLAQRRALLLAAQAAMVNEVNNADGTLIYGTAFHQAGRVQELKAVINQAITGIDWSFTFIWSLFPNESGYATVEMSATTSQDVESGDETLVFAGTILAPDEALAMAKLGDLRATVLDNYGYDIAQQLKAQNTSKSVYANGDATAGLADVEAADGTTFLELTFSEEYRQRMATLLGYTMGVSSRTDNVSGLILTTYAGTVTASGSTANAAYTTALAKAQALGSGRETFLDNSAFLRSATIVWDQRQTQATNAVEFVKLNFTYEYQGKVPAGSAYLEVNTDSTSESFGNDSITVSGFVIAVDGPTANSIYQAQVKASYAGMLLQGERLNQSQVSLETTTGYTTQDIRLEFSFTAFVQKTTGTVTYRYAISVSNDYLQLERRAQVRGSVYASSATVAGAAATALLAGLAGAYGSQVSDSHNEDHEYTSASGLDEFMKYDFEAAYVAAITGIANLLEMQVTESVKFSGVRWVVQPIPRGADGSGGVSIPQDAGLEPGGRTVKGSVSAANRADAEAWAKQQRALLTGDDNGNSYPLPEELELDYEFVPRVDGVLVGTGVNVRIYRVNFTFGEVLPYYPPT